MLLAASLLRCSGAFGFRSALGWLGGLRLFRLLLRVTDDTASESSSRFSRDFTLRIASSAEVVLVGVDDGRPTDDAILPVESDSAILEIDLRDAGTIGVHIPEIARVAVRFAIIRRPVIRFARIEMRPRRSAFVRLVAELVDVEAVLSFLQASDFPLYLDGTFRTLLGQIDDAFDQVAGQHAYGFDDHDDKRWFCY